MAIPNESLPRGKYKGRQVDGPPKREADRFQRCRLFGGYIECSIWCGPRITMAVAASRAARRLATRPESQDKVLSRGELF